MSGGSKEIPHSTNKQRGSKKIDVLAAENDGTEKRPLGELQKEKPKKKES